MIILTPQHRPARTILEVRLRLQVTERIKIMVRRTEGEAPQDKRLSRLAGRLAEAFEQDPEYREGDRGIFMLTDIDEESNSLCMSGYSHDGEAVADMLVHVRAALKVNGIDMRMMSVPKQNPANN